jgi:peptide/nickel transport system permease protein
MAVRPIALLALLSVLALAGPWLAPYDPTRAFRGYWHAPPMPPRMAAGWRAYPVTLVDRLEQRFEVDRSRTLPLPWGRGEEDPVFLLGADRSGRDVLSRLLAGARVSVGLALVAVALVTILGVALGALAGAAGGWVDDAIMRGADVIVALPVLYVIVALRAALPLVLDAATVFVLTCALLALVGWPFVARGVRAIVAREREREYVLAARALGAGRGRVLVRHLLPACAGHVAAQASLLLPAFILAEASLSFLGLGFPETSPTWGTMLREAADVNELTRFPWTLAPAAAIVAVTLGTNLALQPREGTRHP